MELTYPPSLTASLDRLTQTLGNVSVENETAACSIEPELWAAGNRGRAAPAASPLAQFAEFRAVGAYALPLPWLLARVGRCYVPLPDATTRGAFALAWPDATAPWHRGEPLTATLEAGGVVSGSVSVAPFCVPASSLAFLAQVGTDVALVECGVNGGHVDRLGDGFRVTFERTPVLTLAQGDPALQAWKRAVLWERLALVGLTVGLIDRAYRIALDALCEGQRQGSVVAGEQVAQFQLSDNYIDRMAAERLAQDVAIDAERGRAVDEKLALVRYYTSGQAERCAGRALHLASLFLPRLVPIARWLTQRAHHLSVFGAAREHEVRLATAGLAAAT
jgi:hypothetical protein